MGEQEKPKDGKAPTGKDLGFKHRGRPGQAAMVEEPEEDGEGNKPQPIGKAKLKPGKVKLNVERDLSNIVAFHPVTGAPIYGPPRSASDMARSAAAYDAHKRKKENAAAEKAAAEEAANESGNPQPQAAMPDETPPDEAPIPETQASPERANYGNEASEPGVQDEPSEQPQAVGGGVNSDLGQPVDDYVDSEGNPIGTGEDVNKPGVTDDSYAEDSGLAKKYGYDDGNGTGYDPDTGAKEEAAQAVDLDPTSEANRFNIGGTGHEAFMIDGGHTGVGAGGDGDDGEEGEPDEMDADVDADVPNGAPEEGADNGQGVPPQAPPPPPAAGGGAEAQGKAQAKGGGDGAQAGGGKEGEGGKDGGKGKIDWKPGQPITLILLQKIWQKLANQIQATKAMCKVANEAVLTALKPLYGAGFVLQIIEKFKSMIGGDDDAIGTALVIINNQNIRNMAMFTAVSQAFITWQWQFPVGVWLFPTAVEGVLNIPPVGPLLQAVFALGIPLINNVGKPSIKDRIKGAAKNAVDTVKNAPRNALNAAKGAAKGVADGVAGAGKAIGGAASSIRNRFGGGAA